MGLPDEVSDTEATVYAELIVPELIHKPCARLKWCPYGIESLEMAADDEPRPHEDQECLVFESTCPAYVFGNPFCDPSAEDPGYTDGSEEEDGEDHVVLCRECYEELVMSTGRSLV